MRRFALIPLLVFVALGLTAAPRPVHAQATRVKELATVHGVRSNPLVGYGLVVGLARTGDNRRTAFTNQSLSSLMKRMGLNVAADKLDVSNVAAVMVTANLPAFARSGDRIDVLVSSLGNARSLEGGTLLMTPLKGANGKVYSVAQGPLVVGGFDKGDARASVSRNVPTVGRVPGGGVVERGVEALYVADGAFSLSLREPDFSTADRIAQAINAELGGPVARAVSPGSVNIAIAAAAPTGETEAADAGEDGLPPKEPAPADSAVGLIARIENVVVEPDAPARVVVNERTGTVVVGGSVTLGPAAVAHGAINVAIQRSVDVSQPGPFSYGSTVAVNQASVDVQENAPRLHALPATSTVDDLVKSLNALGASPRDLIAILQALKAAGSLNGELVVM